VNCGVRKVGWSQVVKRVVCAGGGGGGGEVFWQLKDFTIFWSVCGSGGAGRGYVGWSVCVEGGVYGEWVVLGWSFLRFSRDFLLSFVSFSIDSVRFLSENSFFPNLKTFIGFEEQIAVPTGTY
jgi:hypothetical protein